MIPIVGPLPLQLINGTPQDAEQVMTLFNWIQSQTNENSIAQNIGFIPTGAITAGNVQDAIAQVPSSSGIQGLTYNMCPDTGSVNAYQGTLSPAITSAGTIVFLTNIKNTNTGPSVLTVNSLSGPILGMSGGALAGGEIQMGSTCAFIGMGSGSSVNWLLLKCTPGILDVSNATADKVLGIGDIATVKFTNATSVPLHIACGDNQIYDVDIYLEAGSSTNNAIYPNNISYGSVFQLFYINVSNTLSAGTLMYDGFVVGGGSNGPSYQTFRIFTSTKFKSVFGKTLSCSSFFGTQRLDSVWLSSTVSNSSPDTTTLWTSLGSFNQNAPSSGSIVIKRYA